jgi:hypothetical protein
MPTQLDVDENLSRILDPIAECFTPEVARKVAEIKADPSVQQRIDELAEKANEGQLTESETAEYDAYIQAMDVLAVIQAKARCLASAAM